MPDADVSDMVDVCGLREWGDTEMCTRPAGHEPVPTCTGEPRPFSRVSGARPESRPLGGA